MCCLLLRYCQWLTGERGRRRGPWLLQFHAALHLASPAACYAPCCDWRRAFRRCRRRQRLTWWGCLRTRRCVSMCVALRRALPACLFAVPVQLVPPSVSCRPLPALLAFGPALLPYPPRPDTPHYYPDSPAPLPLPQLCAIHARRVTIMAKDMQLARRLRGDHNQDHLAP